MTCTPLVCTLLRLLVAAPWQDSTPPAETKPAAPAHRPRSVVFYLIDTCRADHLSVDGYGRPTTPILEELAERGVRFENCFSQAPWTKPSMSAILTSCYPTVTGMFELGDQLSSRFETFPEVLQKNGWYTAGFSANPLMGRLSNYNQGFREFTDATQVIKNGDCIHYAGGSANALNRKVLPWIEKNERWPFLLYVHSVDPHEEYAPSPEYLKLFADPALEPEYRRQWKALLDVHANKIANHCTLPEFEKAGVAVQPFIEYGLNLYDANV